MKKILFTPGIASVEALGSITRLIAIADEIKEREENCQILFRSAGREAKYAEDCGYKTVEGYKPKIDFQKLMSNQYSTNSLCDVMNLKGLISKEYIQNTFNEEVELVKNFKPDIIIGEFETVMPIVAKKMNIPYFCTGGTPNKKDFNYFGYTNRNGYGYEEHYNELLDSLGLSRIENICELNQTYYSSKVLVPSIPELEELHDESKYIFLGSVTPKNFIKSDFYFEKKRPLIYVYLSVSQLKPEFYQEVIVDAFEGSEFDVIVTAGGNQRCKSDNNLNSGNVHFMSMVPSDEVIKMADIAIHHGGQNTTVQCIENKVPSIIFPGKHFERYFNAEKAEQIGCAVNADLSNFTKDFLIKICEELIKDDKFKENLNIYSNKIKSFGGAGKAADLILQSIN